MFYPLYCRGYQAVMRATSKMLAWREPEVIRGAHALSQLPAAIRERGVERVLVVTDRGVQAAGILNEVLDGLRRQGIYAVVYDETVPNPTIGNIEDALAVYHGEACKGIVAVGGGSPMDCAKGVGARVARPDRTIPQMKGLFKVRRRMPPLFAVPTTAGTGSEATLAAVVSNPKTREKYALMDTALIPDVAVLDPTLTLGLPRQVTATTGMDALTHAVEAYIGRSNTPYTEQCSREAVRIIFQSLVHVYEHGDDLDARADLQRAAYLAGVAFTRAYVGYVHAVAHTLGGFYQVPHGLANAVILPYVLEDYGATVHRRLAELADVAGIGGSGGLAEKSEAFIQAIRTMNRQMGIPEKIAGIRDEDIPLMIRRALEEGNPLYPVPKIFTQRDMETVYQRIRG